MLGTLFGLGPIDTRNFGLKVAVLTAENHKWGLEPIETINSGANHADLNAQNDRWGLVSIETCNSGAVSMQKPHMRAVIHRD